MGQNWFWRFVGNIFKKSSKVFNTTLTVMNVKLLNPCNPSKMIDLIESFPDQCCTSPDVRFLGGKHPKYGDHVLWCIQAMYSGYAFRLCIQAMHSGYAFRLFIQAIHSGYSFRLSYRTHFLRHISARRGLSGAFLRQSLFLRSLQITFWQRIRNLRKISCST